MRKKTLKKLAVVFALVLVGFIVLYAFPVEADKSQVEFEASLTVPAGSYQYKSTSVYVPAAPESVSFTASFNVLSGEVVKFQVLDVARFELWQQGIYQPDWVVGNKGSYGIGISSQTAEYQTLNLVALNNASSSSQDVKVWLSKTWHESNKLGLVSGSVIASLGFGITPLLMFGKSKLHLKYSALLFAMAFISVFTFGWAPYWTIPPNPTYDLAMAVPGVFLFDAVPLIALLYLLEKNNGFAYFRNWKMKEKFQVSGAFLMLGYALPIVFIPVSMVNRFWSWTGNTNEWIVWSSVVGLLLMLVGSTIFVGLWATKHLRESSAPIAQQ